jgi:hypothetical protein
MSSPQRDDQFLPLEDRGMQAILRGRDNKNDIRVEDCTKFMDDDAFLSSEVFKDFL